MKNIAQPESSKKIHGSLANIKDRDLDGQEIDVKVEIEEHKLEANIMHGYSYTCSICLNQQSLLPFCCPQHSYCIKCITFILQIKLQKFQIITCPDQTCQQKLNKNSPYFNKLNEEEKKKLNKILKNRQVLSNPQIKLCAKENCDGTIKISQKLAACLLCKTQYCPKCLDFIHKGRCDNKMIKFLKKKHRFRQCPSCKMLVQKNEGCNHMTCLCGQQFCYKCRQKIGSSHSCKPIQADNCLSTIELYLERDDSAFNRSIGCGKLFSFIQLDSQDHNLCKCAQILLILLAYPLANILAIVLTLLFLVLSLVVFVTILFGITIFRPFFEIVQQKLPLSRYLSQKGAHKLLIAILMIFFYPINLVLSALIFLSNLDCNSFQFFMRSALAPCLFFLILPCLILIQEE